MPLLTIKELNKTTKLWVWKISETWDELFRSVALKDVSLARLETMKSESHQKGFLSVRKLLMSAGYTDFDLYYDEFGKPHLKDGKNISITHSHNFSAIILSEETVGIDIELQRDKIIRIADKFCDSEFQYLTDNKEYIRKLTVIWGAKEAIFKIRNEKGISFKNHVKVRSFKLEASETIAELHFDNLIKDFKIYFEEIEGFTLVYAFQES